MTDPRRLISDALRVASAGMRRVTVDADYPKTRNPRLHVVSHTHWDREWYQTFAGYRQRLVTLVDGLMDLLEQNPDFTAFTFDGQVAPIDDYLNALLPEERPAAEARLRALISSGRIQIGPLYTQQDFHLVSGETTLRNLALGQERAAHYGGGSDVGYFPDQFGLIPELPKILNHAGITRVIGERGMKPSLPWFFRWEAADGSSVDVYNIKDHYGGGGMSSIDMRAALRRRGGPTLILSGDDHTVPSAELIDRVRAAGGRLSTLSDFWKDLPSFASTPVHTGEIRSAGNHNLLPNVISNRVDQRIETARAERLLERYAEPLAAFAAPRYPGGLMRLAWENLILNAAHDSACATGIDAVTSEVRVRAQQAHDTAEGIAGTCLRELGSRMSAAGDYVWNPSNFPRDVSVAAGDGQVLRARDVPPLGWARLTRETADAATPVVVPTMRFVDEGDVGDTYTFEPGPQQPHDITLPVDIEQRAGEEFSRLHIRWTNTGPDHRVRIHIALPDKADVTVADSPFGHVVRPAVPEVRRGNDTLNGYPAAKFIIAGGLAIMVDRCAEYELLPDTNELAITLVRSHGKLSYGGGVNRMGGAGPQYDTHDTQMLGPVDWEIAVMPWTESPDVALPWRQWEQFMLPMSRFSGTGEGSLPERGTYVQNVPGGVLSAVLPGTIRTFESTGKHRIIEQPLVLREPERDLDRGVA